MYVDLNGDKELEIEEFKILCRKIKKDITDDEIEYIFEMFDRDQNRKITKEEFTKLIMETDFIASFEGYQDPFIDVKASYIIKQMLIIVESKDMKPEDLFAKVDTDNSQSIEKGEFENLILSIDPTVSNKDIEYAYTKVDIKGTGHIKKEDFLKLFQY